MSPEFPRSFFSIHRLYNCNAACAALGKGKEALEALPESERKDWQALWSKVGELLQSIEGDGSKPKP